MTCRRLPLALVIPALALVACGDDLSQTSGESSDGIEGETSGDEGDSGGDGDGDTIGDGDGDTIGDGDGDGDTSGDGDGDPLPPPPSTGIQIIDVTVDQGVRVPIVQHGNWISPNQRNADLLRDRPALLRAFYLLEPGFVDRNIYAVLTLELDGEIIEYDTVQQAFWAPECEDQQQMECRYGSTIGSFNFRVLPQHVQPGVEFKIETFEASPGHEDEPTAAIPHYPWEGGMEQLGVADSYMKMRVVLVPVKHTVNGSCEDAPDVTVPYGTDYEGNELTAAGFMARELAAHNPVDEVEIILHAPVNWSGSLTNGSLLNGLSQLRAQENAPPEQFYYGVAIPCEGYPEFAGISNIGGPSKNAASQRVSWGVWYDNISTVAETFVHEIGHAQGRSHVACNGEEAGPDPNYPYPGGDTGSFGTHVYRYPVDVHPKNDHDYMSYCMSPWVSEWGWQLVTPWIAELSSWELEGPGADSLIRRPLLFARVDGEGKVSTWIAADYWDPGAAQGLERVELRVDGQVVEVVDALHIDTSHGEEYTVVAPLPPGYEGGELGWIDQQGVRHGIDAGELRTIDQLMPFH